MRKWYDWSPERGQSDFNSEFRQLIGCTFSAHEASIYEYGFERLEKGESTRIPVTEVDNETGNINDEDFDELINLADFAHGIGERLDSIVDNIGGIGVDNDAYDWEWDEDAEDGPFPPGAFGA